MTGGITQVGPMLCFIHVVPHSRLQSILVEEMKMPRENRGGRASQQTFPIGVGRGTSQMEGRAQVEEAWHVQGTPRRGVWLAWRRSVQTRLRGHYANSQDWAALAGAVHPWPGEASCQVCCYSVAWPVRVCTSGGQGWAFLFSHAL